MTKLTDIQTLLLTTAAARGDGSVLPPPEPLGDLGTRIRRSVTALIKHDLVNEGTASADEPVWREEGGERYGVFITDAGRTAIGVPLAPPHAATSVAEPATKIEAVVAMLRREQGATLVELTDATGWLQHTTRAALTRLRQKGHGIEKVKREDATCYRIGAAA